MAPLVSAPRLEPGGGPCGGLVRLLEGDLAPIREPERWSDGSASSQLVVAAAGAPWLGAVWSIINPVSILAAPTVVDELAPGSARECVARAVSGRVVPDDGPRLGTRNQIQLPWSSRSQDAEVELRRGGGQVRPAMLDGTPTRPTIPPLSSMGSGTGSEMS